MIVSDSLVSLILPYRGYALRIGTLAKMTARYRQCRRFTLQFGFTLIAAG
ncbi:MAG: hypothetical protein ACTXOO_00165 [Sodalis sp. (in: enterobacteria)]